MFGSIVIDEADKVFSWYVRKRDGECKRCHSKVRFNEKGLPVSHQASHFYGRRNQATREDPDNVDCLCGGCHQIWGSDDRESYRAFKIKQLGEQGFKLLQIRAENKYFKKDRQMALLVAKTLLSELMGQNMKQIISKGKKILVFNCKNCYTRFKTDEWDRVNERSEVKQKTMSESAPRLSSLSGAVTTCPVCKKTVFTSL